VLLRFLQDRRFRVLGQSQETVSAARILAASNRCLEEEAAAGRFRSDLLYRLNILRLRVPPLRERSEDVPLLCRHFARLYAGRYDLPCPDFPPQALARLQAQAWPGNVRELENAVHRMVLQGVTEPPGAYAQPDPQARTDGPAPHGFRHAKAEAIAAFERSYLCRLMAHTAGNVSAAARLAQTDRRAFGRLLKKHGVDGGRYRDD
jgi:two-component system response regulator GlrR